MRFALALTVLLLAGAAGCTGKPAESTDPTTNSTVTTPPPPSNARFEIANISIAPTNDANRTTLYEDDAGATIRYTIRQPADAGKESAFVTYLLNGRIVDVQQLTLESGKEKTYERTVGDLRTNRTIKVEVRAGPAVQRAEASVESWPRAGEDTLSLGPLRIRADYGLLEQDSHVLVNLSIDNVGPEEKLREFRVKMLCAGADGKIEGKTNVKLVPPTVNNSTGVDVTLDDCGDTSTRYGLEFKATGGDGKTILGRLLLVPDAWQPTPPPQA
ncbi:MAG TPA: hypothetical protein VM370_00425 [Candidatus Thermoplasmatota archaeon]|nr:hypothetical protein [Candidatus Thermoplasmatota archaeon]